jgi:hypothetical protein
MRMTSRRSSSLQRMALALLLILAGCAPLRGADGPASVPLCPARASSGSPVVDSRFATGSFFVMRDGRVGRLWQEGGLYLDTTADGETWQTTKWEAPAGFRYGITPAVQLANGTVLVFSMRRRCVDACKIRAREWFIDIWVTRFTAQGRLMGAPERIWEGYVGDLRRALVTAAGVIVLPFASWRPERKMGPPTGPHEIKVLVSRDEGRSFQLLEPDLVVPVPGARSRAAGYGAVEPAIGRKPDGTYVMLIRNQTDVLWQSESADGVRWTAPVPTALPSSGSPAFLLETSDGSLVAIWNNAYQPSFFGDSRVYGGRDVLHAAIMRPGRSAWEGLREIYVDEALVQVEEGDRGTAYPVAAQLPSGQILVASGQGKGRRRLIRFSPEWLVEPFRVDRAESAERTWVGFQEHGEPVGLKRPRREVAEPPAPERQAVQLRSWDEEGAAALWNFPAAHRGELRVALELLVPARVEVALLDRFVNPYDPALEGQALAKAVSGVLAPGPLRLMLDWQAGGNLRAAFGRAGVSVAAARKAATGYNYVWLRIVPRKPDGGTVAAAIRETCKLPR